MNRKCLLLCLMTFSVMAAFSNNIQLANLSISGQNTNDHFSLVGFDVNWENSWRLANNESNWDAAWVFVKFRKKGASGWQHATINTSGHSPASGAAISTAPDGKGVFIYRSAPGAGNVNFSGNKLRWNYGADAVLDSDSVEVNVFAVEMVYVPQGAFWLGSNGTETAHFRRGDKDSAFKVNSEAAIQTGVSANTLFNNTGAFSGSLGTLPAAYPKGFNAFYSMKYEVSLQQYADFLNNIDEARAANRNIGGFTGGHPNFVSSTPERAAAALSIADAIAYLDWSALRPMTELEYEKACRGANIEPVPNEFAFGNTSITTASGPLNEGSNNETVTSGNVNYGNAIGRALRCGAFANASSTRVSSGGTYYGIMEMSGNSFEYVISAGSSQGSAFTGTHGNGYLNAAGETDNTDAVNSHLSWGMRGGAYNQGAEEIRVSSRYYGNYGSSTSYNARSAAHGFRGVRTAQ